jgi:DNA-binding NarL/FixJ family response regulator
MMSLARENSAKRKRILLADDHDVVLVGLRQLLNRADLEIVGSATNGQALVKAAEELQPDAIITDITMPLLNGIDAARLIRKRDARVKMIFLGEHSEISYAVEALSLGRSGYVLKSSVINELPSAVDRVMRGRTYVASAIRKSVMKAFQGRLRNRADTSDGLTLRQREVLQMLSEGRRMKEIAGRLSLSEKTVEFHKYRVMQKLGVHTLAELARYAVKSGLVA